MGLEIVHHSRHHLGIQPASVRWLPAAPAGESPDGTLVGHRLVVASGHDPSTEQNVLLLANLCIARDREGSSRAVEFERLFSLIHHGAPTCLATCDVATDTVAVVSGSSLGTLHVLTLVVPRYPGSGPEDGRQVSYQETDVLHAGGVTAADVHAGQLRLATAGADGALHLHDMRRMGEPAGTSKGPPRKGATARALCWVSYHEVVTASSSADLEVWDIRAGPRLCQVSPPGWAGGRLCSVAAHPARPNTCLSGSLDGTVALWDMRFGAKPLAASGAHGAGEVWAVAFGGPVTSTDGRGGVGGLGFFATGDGQVGAITEDQGRLVIHPVTEEVGSSIPCVDVTDPSALEEELLYVASNECLGYVHGRISAL